MNLLHRRFAGEHHATAEDTLLAKLEWYRMGGEVSERQWRDVLGILKVQEGRLDLAYLRGWAIEHKVEDLLERAVNDADGLDRLQMKCSLVRETSWKQVGDEAGTGNLLEAGWGQKPDHESEA